MFSFNNVPVDIRVPGQYIEIDNSKAYQGLSGLPARALLIGQKTAAGTAAALTPVQITDTDVAKNLFGAGSQLAAMVEVFREQNLLAEMWAMPQDDNGAGTAATGAVTFSGTVTGARTFNLYTAGRRTQIGVAAAQATSSIATALAAAINANTDLPVTAAVDGVNTSKVNLTAKNKGVTGNSLDIRVNYYDDEELPTGLTATLTAMSGGAGNPDITAAFSALGDEWFTDFVVAYTDTSNLTAVATEMARRFGPTKMIDGHAFAGLSGTHSGLTTIGAGFNSPHLTLAGMKGCPNAPYEVAAALGAVACYYGKQDPARPLQTLPLVGILAPKVTDRFTLEERDLQLRAGISTFRYDNAGTVLIERVITTYQENAAGAPDPSFLDVETLKTLTFLRYDVRVAIALAYPRYKLADDGTTFSRGQAVVTPKIVRAFLIARFKMWEEAALVENVEQFKEDLIVERDKNDPNRINALIPPDIVNQLRVFAGLVQFRL